MTPIAAIQPSAQRFEESFGHISPARGRLERAHEEPIQWRNTIDSGDSPLTSKART
jgi:hypothetical protein